MNLSKSLKNRIKSKKTLMRSLTTFKIGGATKYYFEPANQEELGESLIFAKKKKLKIYCIGSGSNVLADDKGLKGAVIRLNNKNFKNFKFQEAKLVAQAGCLLSSLIGQAGIRNLSGLEYFTGIPGTLGGALVMNAGIREKNIGDLVEDVTIMDYNGSIKTLKKSEIGFGYRSSRLSGVVVLGATLKLKKSSAAKINEIREKLIAARKKSQDWSWPSAGCIFKNPPGESAGKLIDLCGLKGKRVGGAQVSLKHANFIVNKGNATSRDVLRLINIIKNAVNRKFKVKLESEIKIWR